MDHQIVKKWYHEDIKNRPAIAPWGSTVHSQDFPLPLGTVAPLQRLVRPACYMLSKQTLPGGRGHILACI